MDIRVDFSSSGTRVLLGSKKFSAARVINYPGTRRVVAVLIMGAGFYIQAGCPSPDEHRQSTEGNNISDNIGTASQKSAAVPLPVRL